MAGPLHIQSLTLTMGMVVTRPGVRPVSHNAPRPGKTGGNRGRALTWDTGDLILCTEEHSLCLTNPFNMEKINKYSNINVVNVFCSMLKYITNTVPCYLLSPLQ